MSTFARNVHVTTKKCYRNFVKGNLFISSIIKANVLSAIEPAVSGHGPNPPSLALVISTLLGLPLALWTFKVDDLSRHIHILCYVPIGARSEKLGHDVECPRHILCEEIRVPSINKVVCSGLFLRGRETPPPELIIMYLQGNAGSPLHRITLLSKIITSMRSTHPVGIVAVAPRSYWHSTNRTPTENGILADYFSTLKYVHTRWQQLPVVLYGHSLGATVAVKLLSMLDDRYRNDIGRSVKGLILENPFTSTANMVRALYPDKWVPYRYLAPFVFDKWEALSAIQNAQADDVLFRTARNMLVLTSEKDEVVPPEMGRQLYETALGILRTGVTRDTPEESQPKLVVVRGALHENTWMKSQWESEMRSYINKICGEAVQNTARSFSK